MICILSYSTVSNALERRSTLFHLLQSFVHAIRRSGASVLPLPLMFDLFAIAEFLPARRYASAVLAMSVSVCLSVTSRYCIETAERIRRRSYPRFILHCVVREFVYLQKEGYFPLELCPRLWT